jgi:hypothetical protein
MNITKIRPEEETLFWLKPYLPPFSDDERWYKRNNLKLLIKKGLKESF